MNSEEETFFSESSYRQPYVINHWMSYKGCKGSFTIAVALKDGQRTDIIIYNRDIYV